MPDYVHLIGAEQVQSAGHEMARAAEEMRRAASSIDSVLERHRNFLDDWLARFEAAIRETTKETDNAD